MKRQKKDFLPIDLERAEKIRELLHYLYEINKFVPIVVEGKRDKKALREIGFDGQIIILHRGQSLYEFSESIMERFDKVVLLMDWDEKGEELYAKVGDALRGMWEDFASVRELLKILCQKEISEIEDIPILFRRISGENLDVRQWED